MTLAASSQPRAAAEGLTQRHRFLGPWQTLLAVLVGVITVLLLLPEGVADAAQAVAGWLVVGMVAALALLAIVKGLERLQDCEAD